MFFNIMPRSLAKRSVVWEYFDKISEKIVVCKICNRKMKFFSNTTNLMEHLKRLHPTINHQPCQNPPQNSERLDSLIKFPSPEVILKIAEAEPIITADTNPVPGPSSTATSSSFNFPKRKRLFEEPELKELSVQQQVEIDEALILMIVSDFHPLSIVENEGFLKYSKKLQPLYDPPSREKLTKDLLPVIYGKIRAMVIEELNKISHVALTTNIWSSCSSESFLTVTAHYIYDSQIKNSVIETVQLYEQQSGICLSNSLKSVLIEWGIFDKISIIVTNNAATMTKIVNDNLCKSHLPCIAYTLNLCVNEAFIKIEGLRILLEKCKNLVSFFSKSTAADELLVKLQVQSNSKVLKLEQEVPTKWNSRLHMIERLIELKTPLSAAIKSLTLAPECLSSEEWEVLEGCVPILRSLHFMTEELLAVNYPTLSMMIPLIRGLQYSLTNRITAHELNQQLKDHLLEIIGSMLGNLEKNRIAAKATFLDPRFKKLAFGLEENATEAENWIKEELVSLISTDIKNEMPIQNQRRSPTKKGSTNSIWQYFDAEMSLVAAAVTPETSVILQVERYLEMEHIRRTEDPLHFWELHKNFLPDLYKLSKKYLCIPATSVPSKRPFSKAGQLKNEDKSRLSSLDVNYILFLNSNIEKFEN